MYLYTVTPLYTSPPKREPEAWILHNTETGYKTQVATKPVGFDHAVWEAWEIIPLYANPPKREPLSDEEAVGLM